MRALVLLAVLPLLSPVAAAAPEAPPVCTEALALCERAWGAVFTGCKLTEPLCYLILVDEVLSLVCQRGLDVGVNLNGSGCAWVWNPLYDGSCPGFASC